jgi:ABC-2 type transport system ATP-binding protein
MIESMIEVRNLTKRYGPILAVDQLSFTVRPGHVTGFLGPNGAGKSTTIRVALGLDAPTAGEVLMEGSRYARLSHPMSEVGALLEANGLESGRSAFDHLRWLARSHRITTSRIWVLLEEVGLAGVAHRRIATFSLGMRQRLGIAAALLGNPGILLFDEPVNGLDPAGVRWIRELLRKLAAEGRTVFVSSHLMGEMALTAERLIIINRGHLLADTSVAELESRYSKGVIAKSPRAADLARAVERAGGTVETDTTGRLQISRLDVSAIGAIAAESQIPLLELVEREASLEDAYMHLTGASADDRAQTSGERGR